MSNEQRPTYEAPRAMRFAEQPSAAGACDRSGSGDEQCVSTGNSAALTCQASGNSAVSNSLSATGCVGDGNSAQPYCTASGSGFEF
jgi:hypothetical protein